MSDLSNYSLESLLNYFETGLTKSASDESAEDKTGGEEEKKDKSGKDEKELPAFMKKDGDKDKDEKSADKDKEGQTKEASDAGAALAREIMAKVASTQVQNINPMNKQASVAGQALAKALLQKKAYAGDFTTENGVVPGTAGSKVIADNAQMEAEGASYIKPMLLSDGIHNSGTVNEIFDAVVADALGQGAAGNEQVHETGVASREGAVEDQAVPNQVKVAAMNELLAQGIDFDEAAEMMKSAQEEVISDNTDNLEKAAAINELVGRGIDFEDAVALVKQAALEIEDDMEKTAALDQLVAEGVDFDQAIELIKQASAGDMVSTDGTSPGTVPNKNIVDNAQMNAEGDSAIKPMPTGDGIRNTGTVNQIFDAVVADALSQGAAGNDQVHQTGVAGQEGAVEAQAVPNQVKVAAMNKLLDGGFDFDEALAIVKEAASARPSTSTAGAEDIASRQIPRPVVVRNNAQVGAAKTGLARLSGRAKLGLAAGGLMAAGAAGYAMSGKDKGQEKSASEGGPSAGGGYVRRKLRGTGEAILGTVGGGMVGSGIGRLAKGGAGGIVGATVGSGLGAVVGYGHGNAASIRNQYNEVDRAHGREGTATLGEGAKGAARSMGRGLLEGGWAVLLEASRGVWREEKEEAT